MKLRKDRIATITRNENVAFAVNTCLDRLVIPDLTGKTVLLKPNVGRVVGPKEAVNTNPDVVSAVFHYLKEKFNAKYIIGDSPIINTDTKEAFEQSGYSKLINEPNIQFVDLDDRPPVELDILDGKILKKIKLTGYWEEFDYIISIPVLKMHMHTGASLSFKNMKGLIYKREKITLHHLQAPDLIEKISNSTKKIKELDIAISDLARVMQPDLVVIDASYAQEGMGPSSGNIVKMDTIIASTNFLAADILALAITQPEWTLDDVPHLKLISEIFNNGPKNLDDVQTKPENIQEYITSLEPPPSSISIKYENVNLVDIDSCSACLSTIFNLLKNNKEFIDKNYTKENPLNLAIGKGIKQSDLYEKTFLIGNCTSKQRKNGVFIRGCTPVESTIMKIIKEEL